MIPRFSAALFPIFVFETNNGRGKYYDFIFIFETATNKDHILSLGLLEAYARAKTIWARRPITGDGPVIGAIQASPRARISGPIAQVLGRPKLTGAN